MKAQFLGRKARGLLFFNKALHLGFSFSLSLEKRSVLSSTRRACKFLRVLEWIIFCSLTSSCCGYYVCVSGKLFLG